jgi:hypothetical protein
MQAQAEGNAAMDDHRDRDKEPGFDDPDASPWPALALLVIFILLCLIIVANIALAILRG